MCKGSEAKRTRCFGKTKSGPDGCGWSVRQQGARDEGTMVGRDHEELRVPVKKARFHLRHCGAIEGFRCGGGG